MLLDLDQSSMTVWKNDMKLGGGEGAERPALTGDSARIASAPAPGAGAVTVSQSEEQSGSHWQRQRRAW